MNMPKICLYCSQFAVVLSPGRPWPIKNFQSQACPSQSQGKAIQAKTVRCKPIQATPSQAQASSSQACPRNCPWLPYAILGAITCAAIVLAAIILAVVVLPAAVLSLADIAIATSWPPAIDLPPLHQQPPLPCLPPPPPLHQPPSPPPPLRQLPPSPPPLDLLSLPTATLVIAVAAFVVVVAVPFALAYIKLYHPRPSPMITKFRGWCLFGGWWVFGISRPAARHFPPSSSAFRPCAVSCHIGVSARSVSLWGEKKAGYKLIST